MRNERKHYAAEEEVATLRRRLLGQIGGFHAVRRTELTETVLYLWQKGRTELPLSKPSNSPAVGRTTQRAN